MEQSQLPAISVDTAKHKISIALTKISSSIQKLQDTAAELVVTEDQESIDSVKAFLAIIKNVENTISETHANGKKPYLEGGKAWDQAKNEMMALIRDIKGPIGIKYSKVCEDIATKSRAEERRKADEKRILAGIETNILDFSTQIANCNTKMELTLVESKINLEKSPSRSAKYGQFHQKAIDRFNEVLLPIIKDQKVKIDKLESLQKKVNDETDPEQHEQLQERIEVAENEITQNKIKVQEQAFNQPIISESSEVAVIQPTVKARRTDMQVEIDDVAVAFKYFPHLLKIELNISEAKKLGKQLQEAGKFTSDTYTFNGLKFTIKKTW